MFMHNARLPLRKVIDDGAVGSAHPPHHVIVSVQATGDFMEKNIRVSHEAENPSVRRPPR